MKKNLLQKILKPITPLIFAGSLFFANPQPSFAEASEFSLSGGLGIYSMTEEIAKEVYGSFPRIKVGLDYAPKKIDEQILGRLELGIGIMYANKDGQPLEYTEGDIEVESSSNCTIITIQPGIKYFFNEKDKVSPYIGVSFPWMSMTEQMEASGSYDGDTEEVTVKARAAGFGLGLLAGLNFPIKDKLSLFIEGSYSKVNAELKEVEINGEEWEVETTETANIGGLALEAGLKFEF